MNMTTVAHILMTFLTLSTGLVNAASPPPPTPSDVPSAPTPTPGGALSPRYYDGLCPSADTQKFQNITDTVVAPLIAADTGLPAALMRMVFHDSFVEGCDASVLLNPTLGNLATEKTAPVNLSLRGFQVIDAVKTALELICPGVFSCADILQEVALAAQRHVNQTNPRASWPLRYGRRDGVVSNATKATQNLPTPNMTYTQLVTNFAAQGLNRFDLVTLSGAHTFGVAACITFSQRLYNFSGNGTGTDPDLDPDYAASLKAKCPNLGFQFNVVKLDVVTPDTFDNQYYHNIKTGRALLASDNALRSDPQGVNASDASNTNFVTRNFARSFNKMTEIGVKLYPNGQIRSTCGFKN